MQQAAETREYVDSKNGATTIFTAATTYTAYYE